ncbi:hypothetical protein BV20DRAFT_940822 [Pilatotrama ljubarskyi]|nr:hypothetical protein BV20DRAFT_940822 [Pilatotrama ljubarskyi]
MQTHIRPVVPTDPYELLHWNMVLAHQTYELGYMTIVSLLDHPPTRGLRNFLGYCEAWAHSVLHHHVTGEATVFRALSTRMDFSHEREQHEEVHSFLVTFITAIEEAQRDLSRFDAAKLKGLLETAKDAIVRALRHTLHFTHFSEEVSHIEGPKLQAAGFTETECRHMIADMEKHAKGHGHPFLVVPYMRSHTPPEFKSIWPPMPWVIRQVVVPLILARKHPGYWKYAPYTVC